MAIVSKKKTKLEKDLNMMYLKRWGLLIISIIFFIFYKPLAILSIIVLIFSLNSTKMNKYNSGVVGESYVRDILSTLDDSYYLFCDVTVESEGKISQLDTIVIGDNGIFVIEVKNINGNIEGDILDYEFTIEKTGKKGRKYYKNMYNPYKQVKTHVYRLSKYLNKYNIYYPITGLVFFKCNNGIFGPNNLVNVSNSEGIIYDNAEELLNKIKFTSTKNLYNYKYKIIEKIDLICEKKK